MNNDVYEYIINFVQEEDIMNMLSVNKFFYNEKILLRIMNKRFPVLSNFRKEEEWRQFYIKMLFSIIELKKLNIPYIAHPKFNPDEILSLGKFKYSAFLSYSIECINYNDIFLEKTKNFNLALKSSVKVGDMKLIEFFIDKGADLNSAFSEVVKSGKNIDFFLDKGANNFNKGLTGAVKGKNIKLVSLMIEKGANNLQKALEIALKTNQIDIINFLLTKNTYKISNCLEAAAKGGNIEMVKFFISKLEELERHETHGTFVFNIAIKNALKKNHKNILNLLLHTSTNLNYGYILGKAIKNGNIDLINLCLNKNEEITQRDLYKAIKYDHLDILQLLMKINMPNSGELMTLIYIACLHGKLNFVRFLYPQMEDKYIHVFVGWVTMKGNIEIIKYFISQGYNNYEKILSEGYMYFDIIKLMIEKGAKNFEKIFLTSDKKYIYFLSAIKKIF